MMHVSTCSMSMFFTLMLCLDWILLNKENATKPCTIEIEEEGETESEKMSSKLV